MDTSSRNGKSACIRSDSVSMVYLAVRPEIIGNSIKVSFVPFSCKIEFSLTKQSKKSRSVLSDGSRFLGFF